MPALLMTRFSGTRFQMVPSGPMSGGKKDRVALHGPWPGPLCARVTVKLWLLCQERRRIYLSYTENSMTDRRERSPSELRVTFGNQFTKFGIPGYSINTSGVMY